MNITELLQFCTENHGSDLHLSSGLPPMLRVDGMIKRLNAPVLKEEDLKKTIKKILPEESLSTFYKTQEADFSYEVEDLGRFRCNAFFQQRGLSIVFRCLPTIQTLEALGLGEIFKKIALKPRGLCLVTGPTGSGKSTTLSAMIDYINQQRCQHILTIEDPIEFIYEPKKCLINQRELNHHTRSFHDALRAAMREDPDIILVGEMRDHATIRLALTAAETGHLVFATLHTSSAPQTIDRIIDTFAAEEKSMVRSMLAESLEAVITQTLLKKEGGGRIAAYEIMLGTPAIRNLIRENKTAQMYSTMQTSQHVGMQTLDAHLDHLLKKGLISRQTAKDIALYPDKL